MFLAWVPAAVRLPKCDPREPLLVREVRLRLGAGVVRSWPPVLLFSSTFRTWRVDVLSLGKNKY